MIECVERGVEFVSEPRSEPYGQVAVSSMSPATAGIYLGRGRLDERSVAAFWLACDPRGRGEQAGHVVDLAVQSPAAPSRA